jgi:predicted RNase H-like nuclease (RuvC/YqgF family)
MINKLKLKWKQVDNNENMIARLTTWFEGLHSEVNLIDKTATDEIRVLNRQVSDLNVTVGNLKKQIEELKEVE